MKDELSTANRKRIFAGEHQPNLVSVSTHPFRWQVHRFTRPDIPPLRVKRECPRSPWFGRVIDCKSASKTRVLAAARLAPEVPLCASAITDTRAITVSRIREYRAALLNLRRPNGIIGPFRPNKKFVSSAVADLVPRYARQRKPICAFIGAV